MRVRWLLMMILAGGAIYFALFGGDYSFFEVRRLEKERMAEYAKLRELQAELVRLKARADSLQKDSATLERVAREKYGLIRDGERLYRFVDSVKSPPETTPKRGR